MDGLCTNTRRIAVSILVRNMKKFRQTEFIRPVKKQNYLVEFTFTGKKSMGKRKSPLKSRLHSRFLSYSPLSIENSNKIHNTKNTLYPVFYYIIN